MSSIRSILEKLYNTAWVEESNYKENNPEDGDIPSKREQLKTDQALKDISELIDGAKPKLMSDTSLIYKKWSVEMILNEYQSNLKELLK